MTVAILQNRDADATELELRMQTKALRTTCRILWHGPWLPLFGVAYLTEDVSVLWAFERAVSSDNLHDTA